MSRIYASRIDNEHRALPHVPLEGGKQALVRMNSGGRLYSYILYKGSITNIAALEECVLCFWCRSRFRPLQHLIAEQGSRHADIQTVDADLIDIATMSDAHVVVRQVEKTAAQSGTFRAHH